MSTKYNEIKSGEYPFRVTPLPWDINFLNSELNDRINSYHLYDILDINYFLKTIYQKLKNELKVDFFSDNDKNNFEMIFNKVFEISNRYGISFEYYGIFEEVEIDNEFGYYLKILFASEGIKIIKKTNKSGFLD